MKVKIIKCTNEEWWHSEYVEQVVEVINEWSLDAYLVNDGEFGAVLPKIDLELEDEHMKRKIEVSDVNKYVYYRHFKGKWYKILSIANHTETDETLIIYQALYGNREIYARPKDMFLSEVDKEKYPEEKQQYRFMSIDELIGTLGKGRTYELLVKEMMD